MYGEWDTKSISIPNIVWHSMGNFWMENKENDSKQRKLFNFFRFSFCVSVSQKQSSVWRAGERARQPKVILIVFRLAFERFKNKGFCLSFESWERQSSITTLLFFTATLVAHRASHTTAYKRGYHNRHHLLFDFRLGTVNIFKWVSRQIIKHNFFAVHFFTVWELRYRFS